MKNHIADKIDGIIVIVLMLLLVSCGSHTASVVKSTGSIKATLVWVDSNGKVMQSVGQKHASTAPPSVATVRIIVTASDMNAIQQNFPASAGQGQIDGIPAGANRTFTAEGLDSNGTVIYQGSISGVTIQAGQTTNVGTVVLTALITTPATWSKTYGGPNIDSPTAIFQTSDGGYVVIGYTRSFSIGNTGWGDIWIFKLDASGVVQWQKVYGGPGDDEAYSAQTTSDGGYVLAGSFSSDSAWILKLDQSENIQWQETLGLDTEYGNSFSAVTQTSDGGYIAAETKNYQGQRLIFKFDSTGNIIWQKSYSPIYDGVIKIFESSDGGYLMFGSSSSIRIDVNGNMLWSNIYSFDSMESFRAIQRTSDGGYIATGASDCSGCGASTPWLAKLDSSGNIMWRVGSNLSGLWSTVTQAVDGGYIVGGYQGDHIGGGHAVAWILKFDINGTIVWQRTYGTLNLSDSAYNSYINQIQQTSDNGYIAAGTSKINGVDPSGNGAIWILKLDSSGNMSGCSSGLVQNSNATISAISIPTTTNRSITAANLSIVPTVPTVTITDTNVAPGNVCSGVANQNPVISSLTASPSNPTIGQSVTLICNASDPDSDSLEPSWTASGGTITGGSSDTKGTVSTATWQASSGGTYTITCSVTDHRGGSDSKTVNISVATVIQMKEGEGK